MTSRLFFFIVLVNSNVR